MGWEYTTFQRTEFPTQFGRRLRQWRHLRGLSQVALAHRAGYVVQTIGNLERGDFPPLLTTVFALAQALEVHPKTLLFGDEEE
jgi:transcriptional regulator with XRE-family HTH domain